MKKTISILTVALGTSMAFSATVSVVAPQEGAASAVTVGGKATMEYAAGASAPLKATASAGWAFAGWYECYDPETEAFSNEVALAGSADWRSPSVKYVVGDADATLYARFVRPAEDRLSFDMAAVFANIAVESDD